nr:hypothetical protein BaRGS_026324 [Batillaria attramentaria]
MEWHDVLIPPSAHPTDTPRNASTPKLAGCGPRLKEDQYEDLPDIPLPGRQTPIGMAEPSQSYPGPVDDNPYVSMDPVNKHYYYRLWRKDPPRPIKPM